MGFLTLIFIIGYNGSSVGANFWLAKWSTDEDNGAENMTHSTLVFHSITQCIYMHVNPRSVYTNSFVLHLLSSM